MKTMVSINRLWRFALAGLACLFIQTAGAEEIYGMRGLEGEVVLRAVDLGTGTIREVYRSAHGRDERLASMFRLPNGKIAYLHTVFNGSSRNRLTVAGESGRLGRLPEEVRMLGDLTPYKAIQSLIPEGPNTFLGIVGHVADTAPFSLVRVQYDSGRIDVVRDIDLGNTRYSNLARCPDGTLWATRVDGEGEVELVQFDMGKQQILPAPHLILDGNMLISDFKGLACSSENRLYGLGNPRYEPTSSLYSIESNGVMHKLMALDADKILFLP